MAPIPIPLHQRRPFHRRTFWNPITRGQQPSIERSARIAKPFPFPVRLSVFRCGQYCPTGPSAAGCSPEVRSVRPTSRTFTPRRMGTTEEHQSGVSLESSL
ncbi:unnamed protein product [Lota lota]